MSIRADDDPVIFKYDSSHNVSFTGDIESGYTWGDWRDLSDKAKSDAMEQAMWELVDIYVSDEFEEDDK